MQRTTGTFGLAAALVVLSALKAVALTVLIQLTPNNLKFETVAFQITSEDRDNMKRVNVTVTAKKEPLSPGLLARLKISDETTDYALVPVEETRDGDKVTYWFNVAPNLLAKSRFEFDVLSGQEVIDGNGKTHFVAVPGTIEYWFYIGDFVSPSKKAGISRASGPSGPTTRRL